MGWQGSGLQKIETLVCHPRRKSVSRFWAKSRRKIRKSSLNPFTTERRDLISWGNGVIFRGESAVYAQKFVGPPKRTIFDLMLHFCCENFIKKILRCRKIKCRESSETRFGKVSRRSEPSSRGKRPFEIRPRKVGENFKRPKNREDSSDLDENLIETIAASFRPCAANFCDIFF